MATLHHPTLPQLPDMFTLSAAFGMTPAEARVALALATGASLEEVAKQHVVSVNTIKSQARTACEKAKARGTRELASVVHALGGGIA